MTATLYDEDIDEVETRIRNMHRVNMMGELKSILLATDGSAYSRGAIREAIGFAGTCKTALKILRVIGADPAYEAMGHHYSEGMRDAAMAEFDDIREYAALNNVECDVSIRRAWHIHEAIIREAEDGGCDIIIMGRHGLTGIKELLLGSVTARVIAHAKTKVLVVPKDSEMKGETIMLATDGSACSANAEEEAINMAARCPNAKSLVVVTVVSGRNRLAAANRILEDVSQKARHRGVKTETLALVGEPYKAVVNAAAESGADIAILGTHGRTGLAGVLIGSVAERVIALSVCPVLVVK
jgi:hypothetical protein